MLLWDIDSGRRLAVLAAHRGPVWSLAWSVESAQLASGGADGTLRIWDAAAAIATAAAPPTPGAAALLGGGSCSPLGGPPSALLRTLPTRAAPVQAVRFTRANLLLAAGASHL